MCPETTGQIACLVFYENIDLCVIDVLYCSVYKVFV